MIKQERLTENKPFYGIDYDRPQFNDVKGKIQRTELHRGCPWAVEHEYCYEPDIYQDLPIPEITKNQVQILDMNPLARKDILDVIRQLGEIRVNKKSVKYEFVCGIDFRFLTSEIAEAMKASRFEKVRIAWDGPINDQILIKKALEKLIKAGYKAEKLMVFMLVNWKIPFIECLRKLDIMKVWGVKVCDCCYDGGYNVAVPVHWILEEMNAMRRICRKHNRIVLYGIDPRTNVNPLEVLYVRQ